MSASTSVELTSPSPSQMPSVTSLTISLATLPVLVGLLGSHAIADIFHHVGLASEELFRGERLPILAIPTKDGTTP
ncbi:hypothetical protein XM38_003510 [Halomicronema hongdechloris C2206]|uniref:Uncharacterized protein n=1 Tax=Halomicronema hongdechloris C2206 TaxID=1641165 RepID=A0A1Z3HGL9_9CYAN|nr:hypothetical protein [Halomicronema hongdechloris]ASC69424.1 hypothetical protein XM38_003510 [Halomicronema hongdechloris C2206]